ncbi:glutaredoxin [Thalassotalea insulae]|uniref:Glutaredoxin n=1 Tax=Thalassotalea insulae TaxID=2056778 RepID=A0ABQ6GXR7_9GAMM|nr:glutaredoxin [Thalassotalea insulae]GLX79315.1 glutaredoxin [Thalassotalea insulae]
MFILRWLIGRIILFFDFVFSPKKPKRAPELQNEIDESTAHLSLYQLPACPFCVKVRRAMKRGGLNIAVKNINKDNSLRQELVEQGGKHKVPCLKIVNDNQEVTWLYESSDIKQYIQQFVR